MRKIIMSFWIALPDKGDGYKIYYSAKFSVKANARNYADRMGWDDALIVTDKQKEIIESGGSIGEEEAPRPEPPQATIPKKGKK